MYSVVLGVKGERLGVLQLVSTAVVDPSEEPFTAGKGERRRGPSFLSCLMSSKAYTSSALA